MITHILKSGQQVKDIAGHKVTKKDVPTYYEVVSRVKARGQNEKRSS